MKSMMDGLQIKIRVKYFVTHFYIFKHYFLGDFSSLDAPTGKKLSIHDCLFGVNYVKNNFTMRRLAQNYHNTLRAIIKYYY